MKICIYKHKPRVHVTLRILEAYERAFKRQGHSVLIMTQDMERFSQERARNFAKKFLEFKADLAICYGFSAMPRIAGGYFFRKRGIPLAILCFENPFFGLNQILLDEIKAHQDYYAFFVWDTSYLDLMGRLFKNCFPIYHAADVQPGGSVKKPRENRMKRDLAFVGNIPDFLRLREERLVQPDTPHHLIDHILKEKMARPCMNLLELCAESAGAEIGVDLEPQHHDVLDPRFHQQILFPVYQEGLGAYRHLLLNRLRKFPLHYFGGASWPSEHITFHRPVSYNGELSGIYQTTAINLDIPPFQSIDALDNRVFDAAGAGAFVLTQRSPQLCKLFDDADKIAYTDFQDLEEKIRFYLDHPNEREAVSEGIHRCIMERHTYDHRVPYIVETTTSSFGLAREKNPR
jgi:spore maturation protein CgeB